MKPITSSPSNIQQEIKLSVAMIDIYYKKSNETHKISHEEMIAYATNRLEHCPHGENKPTCKNCPIHCYKKEYREQMKQIMRFSGPRIMLYHPILALKHFMNRK